MEYHLCSEAVIEHFNPKNVSKPFKSGYEFDKETNYFVAEINFEEVDSYYKNFIEPYNEKSRVKDIDFWTRRVSSGTMDVTKITKSGINKKGLFVEIENKTGLTNKKNRALCIHNLTNMFGFNNPIDFINSIA